MQKRKNLVDDLRGLFCSKDDMAIEALCPNGHKISCPDETRGRTAKCPRCSAPFRVPDVEGSPDVSESSIRMNASAFATPVAAVPVTPVPVTPVTVTPVAVNPTPVTPVSVTAVPAKITSSPDQVSAQPVAVVQPATPVVTVSPVATPANVSPVGTTAGKSGINVVKPATSDSAIGLSPMADLELAKTNPRAAATTYGGAQISGASPSTPGDKSALRRDLIAFLCPSGHKLTGPSKLAGKLGQCPHCGQKFQIPPLDDIRAAQQGEVNQSMSFGSTPTPVSAFGGAENVAGGSAISVVGSIGIHPLADLMYRLWSEREHGGIIELHLKDGVVLMPDWFEKKLSSRSHGLFASSAADGTVTMTIVPWDGVQRVVIRGVVGLPDQMFE